MFCLRKRRGGGEQRYMTSFHLMTLAALGIDCEEP